MGVGQLPVLIVGAGPTGLVLALWLAKANVAVRIVDRELQPGTTSRAVGVQARTLEFYRQLGIADAVVRDGTILQTLNIWSRSRRVGAMTFGRMGDGSSPFPYLLVYPQDEHERLLIRELEMLGIRVERGMEFLDCEQQSERVVARLRRSDGAEERAYASYLAGCDGAHSRVRAAIGARFDGGTYDHVFFVADVVGEGVVFDGDAHGVIAEDHFLVIFPMRGARHARLIGSVRESALGTSETLSWRDVDARSLEAMRLVVRDVRWFSTYRVHHRVASYFRDRRAFVLGDAAHVHSPVGGQGMNTGIGDAVNLAWKLAAVLDGRCPESILATYEPERIAFARRLVATTDRVFTILTSGGASAKRLRPTVTRVLGVLTRLRFVRRLAFRTVSQLAIGYRKSAIARGSLGRVRAGDRLPWIAIASDASAVHTGGRDNHAVLDSRAWQVHSYGTVRNEIASACARHAIAYHVFAWDALCGRANLPRDSILVVRPDGHLGCVARGGDAATIVRYLDETLAPFLPRETTPATDDATSPGSI